MSEPASTALWGGEITESRFEKLFTAIDEGYCLCEIIVADDGRPVDYRFLETNPLFEEMTGLEDAVGRTALELVPDLEPHWVETYARAALGGERIRFQQGSDALQRWFDVFTMPIGPDGCFAIVFKDDTERHLAVLALQASGQRHRELADHERRNSLRLQHALLPTRVVHHPDVVIAAHYEASTESDDVGGDWYDTFVWPDGRVGLMVGDVAGHNLDAAAAMGHLRAGVAALAPHISSSPAAWLDALAECASGPNGTAYATAAAVVVDSERGTVSSSLAGHPPPLLVAPDGAITWLKGALSPPVGSIAWTDRHEHTLPLTPGSIIVLFSDGLIERRDEPLDDALTRLATAAAQLRDRAPDSLCRALMAEMVVGHPDDDVVIVAARYQPSGGR